MMFINKRELLSAGLMVFFGVGVILNSLQYNIGSLARMGPGFFPLLLGAALTFIGAIAFVGALTIATPFNQNDATGKSLWGGIYRPWLVVIAGIFVFMVLGIYGGLIPATFALIFVTTHADRRNTTKSAFILATCVTIAAVVVFYFAMQMQFPLFRWG